MNWIAFIVIGILLALGVWILQSKWKIAPKAIVSIIVLAALFLVFYVLRGPKTLGADSWYNLSPWKEIFYFVIMTVGMAARYLNQAIQDQQARLAARPAGDNTVIPIRWNKWAFVLPFTVSVMTYGFLMSQIKDQLFSIQSVVICFQSGFFWQTIFDRTQGTVAGNN